MAATMQRDVENWDDDELEGPILPGSLSAYQPSMSSRLSVRSESLADEDWNLPAPRDEQSTTKAITSAKLVGIPIPSNVPASALTGGSIKRLGSKKPAKPANDDWDEDLDFAQDTVGQLKLKSFAPTTPLNTIDDDDFDWADGSLGVRHGGLRQPSTTLSPSFSMRSPSMVSVKTAESEDDFGGLMLPMGPLDFGAALKKRSEAPTESLPEPEPVHKEIRSMAPPSTTDDDFSTGIDFGPGDVFDPQKRTLNRNVKQQVKTDKPMPKVQASVTFGDKPNTRIPRPVNPPPKPLRLEPVLEPGANAPLPRRLEQTMAGAQMLRSKRSMPVLRGPSSFQARQPGPAPSFANNHNRSAQARALPYLSHGRRESDPNRPQSPSVRPHSRLSHAISPQTPTRLRRDIAPAALAREAAAKRQVTHPARKRDYGNGTELDTFDDLPTSASKESLFTKQPSAKPPPKTLRSYASQSRLSLRDKMTTPLPANPRSPSKPDNLPRFARDTAASRIAREQTLGGTKPRDALLPRPNYQVQALKSPQQSPNAKRTTRKGPTLVAPIGKENAKHWQDDAAKKGMRWNPVLFRWEGNEKAVQGFEPAAAPPSPPRPALITNFGGPSSGALVSGNMVFDNQAKKWLKLARPAPDPRSPSVGDDDDDPFRDIEDLRDEHAPSEGKSAHTAVASASASAAAARASIGEWLVGEEFDVGPQFIRQQQDEEAAWRERVEAWFGGERDAAGDAYKWAIRDIAANVSV